MINKNSNIKMNLMKYIHSLYIGLLSLLFVGCQEEQLNNMQTGGFLISLNDDVSTEVTTKNTPAELGEPATENFKLKIVNETTNNPLYDGAYKSGTIPASAGTYTVTASFGDNSLVALDEPYYKGEETRVVVEEGKTTSVQLACKVANALASVIFPDATEMAKIYESYWVKVAVENYSVKLKPNSTNSAYFQVGKEVSFYFEGEKLNGQSVSAKLEHNDLPTTFEAADHYTLTLTFNDDLTLDISKVEATTVTINETIPMEWLPKPKVEAEGFEGNELSFVETENKTASIKLVTATALQDLKLKFNFEDEQFISSLPKEEYVLSNPEDKQAIETALGITLPEIGTTDASLDLSPLLAKLQTNAGVATDNSIEIDAKANNRWSSEEIEGQETPNLKYTLVCNKPEFTVSAYPGNIWTKEFTMNALMEKQVTKGDFSKLSKKMKYQFSTNGESDWDDLGEDLRKVDLTPGRTYYIRGVYRGEVCSDPVAVSTYPIIELENGGLEGARITIGTDGKIAQDRGARYAWDGWATTNPLTTPNCHAAAYAHNSRSGVRPTTDKPNTSQGTEAVRVITIGYGYGSTYKNQNYFIHSELFLGTDPEEENDNRTYGISYASHPTGISFYYKCISNVGNDFSEAKIEIYHENELLGSGVFQTGAKSNYEYKKLDIKYIENEEILKLEPTKIVVIFKSGTKSDLSQSDLKKMFGSDNFITGNTNTTADCMWRGNELFIDDISLVYDK